VTSTYFCNGETAPLHHPPLEVADTRLLKRTRKKRKTRGGYGYGYPGRDDGDTGAVMAERQQQQLLERALAHVLTASRAFDASEASQHNRPRDAQATEMATERNAASAREGIQTELACWELYDISGAVNPAPEQEMREQFCRFRASRGKPVDRAREDSLRMSWNAFIRRWNFEPDFRRDLETARVRAQSIWSGHAAPDPAQRVLGRRPLLLRQLDREVPTLLVGHASSVGW
jgi:hypothetical protein